MPKPQEQISKSGPREYNWIDLVKMTWPFWLIGIPFAWFGLRVLAGLLAHMIQPRVQPEWKDVIGSWLVVGTFGAAGILMLIGGVFLWRMMREERRLEVAHPAEPWLHKSDWSKHRSSHHLVATAVTYCGILICVNSLIFGGMLMFLLSAQDQNNIRHPEAVVAILALFVSVTLCLDVYVFGVVRYAILFRRVSCELVDPPFQPGRFVRCLLKRFRPPANTPIVVQLQCISTRAVNEKFAEVKSLEKTYYKCSRYHVRYVINDCSTLNSLSEDSLSVRFALPKDVPQTDQNTSTDWSLSVSWRSSYFFKHVIVFEIPVFSAPPTASSIEQTIEFDRAMDVDQTACGRIESMAELVHSFYGTIGEVTPETWELRLPRSPLPGPARYVTLFFFFLVFTVAGGALGGISGLLMCLLPWLLWLLTSQQERLRWNRSEIRYQERSWPRVKTRTISSAEIQSLFARQSESGREGYGYQVIARLHTGQEVLLIGNASNGYLANRIAEHLWLQVAIPPASGSSSLALV